MDALERQQKQLDIINGVRRIHEITHIILDLQEHNVLLLSHMENIKKHTDIIIETKKEIDKWQDAPKTLWRK